MKTFTSKNQKSEKQADSTRSSRRERYVNQHETSHSFYIQRSLLCPCDGGCPRCVQAKLKIGAPNDKYEREADDVAEQVMRMPEPALQRAPT